MYGPVEETPLKKAREECELNVIAPARVVRLVPSRMWPQAFARS
jgi:short-subunit dehydrogenase